MRVALDFGTTNSALAVYDDAGVKLAEFWREAGFDSTYPSVLYVHPDSLDERLMPLPITGPQGIDLYLQEEDGLGRLIQSLKSYLASRSFHRTQIFGQPYNLETLIATIVADLRAEAEATFGPLGQAVTCGRPVRFSRGSRGDDDFAAARLKRALGQAGFEQVNFVLEPVAAALAYEQRLERDELVLIGDFGGGTSDFTLMRVGPGPRARQDRRSTILGTHGVATAGNAFDYAVVRALVAPHLGMGAEYMTAMRKVRRIPTSLYIDLEWHRLSLLHSEDLERRLERFHHQALEPDRLEAYLHLVRHNLGYHLYRAVEDLKIALSQKEAATFRFVDDPVHLEFPVSRARFEEAIASPLQDIAACVDALFVEAEVDQSEVDRVFLTGGSSFVPAVQRIFHARFGAHKVDTGDQLTSVVTGLAWASPQS